MNPQQQQPAQWQYKPGDKAQAVVDPPAPSAPSPSAPAKPTDNPVISWTAAEYIEHHKTVGWYLALLGLTALASGLMYLITKDYIAVGTTAILGVLVAVVGGRKPRQIECELSSSGIKIGPKTYPYGQFKSFGVIREGLIPSLELFSVKKLVPAVAVHFDAKDEQKITSALGQHLPYEERKMAGIDKLSQRLRF